MSMNPPPPPPPPLDDRVASDVGIAGLNLAEPWRRLVARGLDFIILIVVVVIVITPLVNSDIDDAGFGGVGSDMSTEQQLWLGLIASVLYFLWDAVCPRFFGGSPMKLAFGMRIVRAESGERIGWKHAVLRFLPAAVLSVIPFLTVFGRIALAIVGVVFIFTKPLRQTVSDLFAKTLVVKTR